MTPQQVDRLMRQVQRAWYGDGIVEMTQGGLLFITAAYVVWRANDPQPGAAGTALRLLGLFLIVVAALGGRRVAFALKKRIMAGRQLPVYDGWPEQRRRRALSAAAAVLAVAVVWGTLGVSRMAGDSPSMARWTPLFLALGLGVALLYLGHRLSLQRFHVLSAVSGVLGALAATRVTEPSPIPAGAAYLGLMGVALSASGVIHLVRALLRRAGRAPGEE